MENSKYSTYTRKVFQYVGGGLILIILGLGVFLWVVYETLVPAPKICDQNWFKPKAASNTSNNFNGLELIGHIGGSIRSVFTTNALAYVGAGPEFAILDMQDPAHPLRIGYLVLPDTVMDIYVEGEYAYAAIGEQGLRIIDVSNPNAPSEVGVYITSVPVNNVVVSKGYAYLPVSACTGGGTFLPERCDGALQIIDVSDPISPSQLRCPKTSGSPISVAIDENYAYISNSDSSNSLSDGNLEIMDISRPIIAGTINVQNTDFAGNTVIAENHLYLATEYHKFRVLDISNPRTPIETGLYDSLHPISETRNAIYQATVSGKYAYITVKDIGLQILDVSDSTRPILAGTYTIEGDIHDISFMDGNVYVATDKQGLQVINVANPATPAKIGAYESAKSVEALEVVNNFIYAAAEGNGMRIIDAVNPHAPVEIGIFNLSEEIMKMAEENDTAYITDVAIEDGSAHLAVKDMGIQVVDISDPFTPLESNFYPLPNGINDIDVRDHHAYVSTGTGGVEIFNMAPSLLLQDAIAEVSSYKMPYYFEDVAAGDKYVYILGDGLLTVDPSDPSAFTQVDFYDINASSIGYSAPDGKYLYLGTNLGLKVVMLSDSGIPNKEVFSELKGINLTDLTVEGNYVYGAASNGLKVVDVSNPLLPSLKGACLTENWTDGLAQAGNYVYLDVRDDGLWIIDVSDPAKPTKVGLYNPPREVRGVAAAGNYAYIAAGEDGLRIVNAANPGTPIETSFLENIGFAEDVAIAGNYAYIAHRSGVVIADITDPYKPAIVKQYDLTTPKAGRPTITLAGDHAYLPSGDDGLWIVNIAISNQTNKSFHYANMYETTGIDVQGDYAYVTAESHGLRIINIADPMIASEVGMYNEPGLRQHNVKVFENLAYISSLNGLFGADVSIDLVAIDISDPGKPRKVASYALPGNTQGVTVTGEYMYVAAGRDGIFIFRFIDPPSK